jgi:hypothetical protein
MIAFREAICKIAIAVVDCVQLYEMFFIAFSAIIEKGGGTGPEKPWQPSCAVIGANSIPENMSRER